MLTEKQKRFCDEYLVDLNGTQAAIRAGYSKRTAMEQSYQLLQKTSVQQFLNEKRNKLADKLEISQERVLKEYARIAFFDIRKVYSATNALMPINDMDDDAAACLAGVEVDEIHEGFGENRQLIGHTVKVKLANKISALDSLGKHLGLFERDNEQKKTEAVVPFTNDQVKDIITQLRKAK